MLFYHSTLSFSCSSVLIIAGEQAQVEFAKSDLDSSTLAEIWFVCELLISLYHPHRTLADVDEDGLLDVGEFILAMHLIAFAV